MRALAAVCLAAAVGARPKLSTEAWEKRYFDTADAARQSQDATLGAMERALDEDDLPGVRGALEAARPRPKKEDPAAAVLGSFLEQLRGEPDEDDADDPNSELLLPPTNRTMEDSLKDLDTLGGEVKSQLKGLRAEKDIDADEKEIEKETEARFAKEHPVGSTPPPAIHTYEATDVQEEKDEDALERAKGNLHGPEEEEGVADRNTKRAERRAEAAVDRAQIALNLASHHRRVSDVERANRGEDPRDDEVGDGSAQRDSLHVLPSLLQWRSDTNNEAEADKLDEKLKKLERKTADRKTEYDDRRHDEERAAGFRGHDDAPSLLQTRAGSPGSRKALSESLRPFGFERLERPATQDEREAAAIKRHDALEQLKAAGLRPEALLQEPADTDADRADPADPMSLPQWQEWGRSLRDMKQRALQKLQEVYADTAPQEKTMMDPRLAAPFS